MKRIALLVVFVLLGCGGGTPPIPNDTPIAHAEVLAAGGYLITSATIGQSVQLNGRVSYDTDGDIVLYEWDEDYNGIDFVVDVSGDYGYASRYSTSFNVSGNQYIALRVTDDLGATDMHVTILEVYMP